MAFALAPEAVAAGYNLASYDTIGSTSTEAMARLRGGEQGPLWVVSRHQSKGKGRRGNAWQSPPGNLAASLAVTLDAEPATVATLGFVAGVAAARALDEIASRSCASPSPLAGEGEKERPRFTLKWPNDVLAGGAKLVGVLVETEALDGGRAVVVGIGVNVAHAPEGLPYPTTSLASLDIAATAETVFATLSAAWVKTIRVWDGGSGFAAVRAMWLERAVGLGRPMAVTSGSSTVSGTFETLDEGGQLMIRTREGRSVSVSAGEVFFGEAGTGRPEVAA